MQYAGQCGYHRFVCTLVIKIYVNNMGKSIRKAIVLLVSSHWSATIVFCFVVLCMRKRYPKQTGFIGG